MLQSNYLLRRLAVRYCRSDTPSFAHVVLSDTEVRNIERRQHALVRIDDVLEKPA